jgi:acyl-coenzyme A thioesterase PaaI-like protein
MTMDSQTQARVSRGRTVITLGGRIEDADGRLHTHGTSTCLVVSRKP